MIKNKKSIKTSQSILRLPTQITLIKNLKLEYVRTY